MQTNQAVGSPKQSPEQLTAAAEYWTEERRNAAKPITMPTEQEGTAKEAAPVPHGEAGQTQHGHGSEKDTAVHGESLGQAVGAPLNYPYRTCGKIFFNQGGGGFAGSAAMVAPNVLLTAGHCVYGNGGWSSNMTFYPSYGKRANNDPVRVVPCGRLSAWTGYTTGGNRAFDYGLVWMGTTPGNIIGWLGLLWNAPTANRLWEAVGYPATPHPPFDGNTMDSTVGGFAASSVSGTQGLTNDNMEHGSSGGPWITAWNEAVRSHANGLQSFHLRDGDTVEYGPHFTQDVKTLFDWISNPANH